MMLGFAWLIIFLVSVLNLFFLLNAPMAEHWLYNAAIGLRIVILSWMLGSLPPKKVRTGTTGVQIFLAMWLLLSAVTAFRAVDVWKDEAILYEHILKYSPTQPKIHYNLGTVYLERGDYERAIPHLCMALRLNPANEDARYNLDVAPAQSR